MVRDKDWIACTLSLLWRSFSVPCRLGSRDIPLELLSWFCFSVYYSSWLYYQCSFFLGSVNSYHVIDFYFTLFFMTYSVWAILSLSLCLHMVKVRQYDEG